MLKSNLSYYNDAYILVKGAVTAPNTENDGRKNVAIIVSLKYLRNFWRNFEMPLINYQISLILTLFENCFIVAGTAVNQVPTFTMTDTKVPVATLLIQDNVRLLLQWKAGFKGTINWNKY